MILLQIFPCLFFQCLCLSSMINPVSAGHSRLNPDDPLGTMIQRNTPLNHSPQPTLSMHHNDQSVENGGQKILSRHESAGNNPDEMMRKHEENSLSDDTKNFIETTLIIYKIKYKNAGLAKDIITSKLQKERERLEKQFQQAQETAKRMEKLLPIMQKYFQEMEKGDLSKTE